MLTTRPRLWIGRLAMRLTTGRKQVNERINIYLADLSAEVETFKGKFES
jgi:hypothetical protein